MWLLRVYVRNIDVYGWSHHQSLILASEYFDWNEIIYTRTPIHMHRWNRHISKSFPNSLNLCASLWQCRTFATSCNNVSASLRHSIRHTFESNNISGWFAAFRCTRAIQKFNIHLQQILCIYIMSSVEHYSVFIRIFLTQFIILAHFFFFLMNLAPSDTVHKSLHDVHSFIWLFFNRILTEVWADSFNWLDQYYAY